jgi:hypothetical protein
MKPEEIIRARVATQLDVARRSVSEVVRGYGAVQAQEYRASLWALALRTPGVTEADVERAIAERHFVRTWPMRGTLHFVPSEDVRWMLRLLTPRVMSKSRARYRELEIDDAVIGRSRALIEQALSGGKALTRPEIFDVLGRAGIATANQRGVHILGILSMRGVLTVAAHRGKQPTFALLEEYVPPSIAREFDDDEALGVLAERYFTGHGPATVQDFAWWAGLPLGEARRALEVARPSLVVHGDLIWGERTPVLPKRASAAVHLLPPFDEYTVAYRDRSAFLDPAHAERTMNGIMAPVVLVGGRIAGTWSREQKKDRVALRIELFAPASATVRRAIERAAEAYGRFLGLPASLELVEP